MYLRYLEKSGLRILVILWSILLSINFAAGGWEVKQLEGDRVILFYPSILSEESAKVLLENEERALLYVEEFLQVQYKGIVKVYVNTYYRYTDCLFGFAGAARGMIIYCYSLPALQHIAASAKRLAERLVEGEIYTHEMVHAVAFQQLGPSSRSLQEGLATAVDYLSRPSIQVDPHLLSKGLLRIGTLKPIIEVLSDKVSQIIYVYQESASFVLFLIQEYGIEKFKAFYSLGRYPLEIPPQLLEQRIQQIYGEDIPSLEKRWQRFLADYAPDLEPRAEYIAKARLALEKDIFGLMDWLEGIYQHWSNTYIGPMSEKVYAEWRVLRNTLHALEHNRSPTEEEDYREFQLSLEIFRVSLERWKKAILTFIDAKELMRHPFPYESIIAKLKQAQELYQSVGDEVIVARTGNYITAFHLLMEGEEQLRMGNNDRAKSLFLKALTIFLKLDEQRLADKIRRLLELCRYVFL